MKSLIKELFIFLGGAAIGGGISYYFTKKKCLDAFNEELNDNLNKIRHIPNLTDDIELDVETVEERRAKMKKVDYDSLSKYINEAYKEAVSTYNAPSIIDDEEAGTLDGYSFSSLSLWADGTVTDDNGDKLDNVEGLLGEGNIQRMVEGDQDCYYIRNDVTLTDYEILIEPTPFESAEGMYE